MPRPCWGFVFFEKVNGLLVRAAGLVIGLGCGKGLRPGPKPILAAKTINQDHYLRNLHIITHLTARLNGRMFFYKVFSFEKPFLENKQGDHTGGNRKVGYIKDGTEKLKAFSPYKREPMRKMRM